MKKYVSILIITIIAAIGLTACSSKMSNSSTGNMSSKTPTNEKIKVVTTIFPEYDWVKQIAGDALSDIELTLLLDNGVDLHSYQPTIEDIMKIRNCDLFIYVGGESDAWVDDVLKQANNKDMHVINLLDALKENVKIEETVPGMQEEEEHDHDEDEEEVEYDEHVWLSLRNAKLLCQIIADALEEIDTIHKDIYEANATDYMNKLSALDEQYKNFISNVSQKTLLFGDRFPFRYLVDDYGLSYYAAFSGCSAESEASFETVLFLAQKVDELGLNSVMTIEKSDQKIARTIVESTKEKNQSILRLDSMQSVTSNDVANGATYLSAMQSNLDVLKKALK